MANKKECVIIAHVGDVQIECMIFEGPKPPAFEIQGKIDRIMKDGVVRVERPIVDIYAPSPNLEYYPPHKIDKISFYERSRTK